MSDEDFGELEIRLVKDSKIIEFEVNGKNLDSVQQKSQGYQGFTPKINRLRYNESPRQGDKILSLLSDAQEKVEAVQKKLSEYKSDVWSSQEGEIRELTTNIEQLHRQQAEILAEEQEANNRLKQLIAIVGIPPGQTSDTSVLQSDRVFRQNLQKYAEIRDKLVELRSKLAPNHPEFSAEKGKQQAVESVLLTRGRWLLGRSLDIETLQRLSINLGSSTASWKSRESLFQELKQVKIDRQRLRNRVKELDQQIAQFESRLRITSQQELEFTSPQTDVQVAEVYAATLTELNSSKSDTSTTFALPVQMVVKPSLPEKPSLDLKLILLAALNQSQQWFTKTTRMATLVVLLGLAGGSWVTNEVLASQIAQAETARIDLSVTSQPNETYETLLSRVETATQAVVQESFDKNGEVTNVTVMVMAENYGAIAPVLSLEVSRSQWQRSPDIQRWGTYLTSARSLLGLEDVAKTTASVAATEPIVLAQQSVDSIDVETENPVTTPNQTLGSSSDPNVLPADAAVPFENVATTTASVTATDTILAQKSVDSLGKKTKKPAIKPNQMAASNTPDPLPVRGNPKKEFSVTTKLVAAQITPAETAHIDLSVTSQPNETYETLLSRAAAATQTAVQDTFAQNMQVTDITVMVMAENYAAIAPVMSMEVSRNQWQRSPNVQRWGTYLMSARSLLGFEDVAPTTISVATSSSVLAQQSGDILGMDDANIVVDSVPAATAVPVAPADGNLHSVTTKLTASQIAQAETARIDLSVTSQPNETYETLLSRAAAATQAAVQDNFEQNKQVTDVTVMVMAENYGAIAPVMSMDVSRSQWQRSPNIQRWGTYLMSARSLLGFEDVATNTAATLEQSETDILRVESLDNSNSSAPETATPVPSQPAASTATEPKSPPAPNSPTSKQSTTAPATSPNVRPGLIWLSTPANAPQNLLGTPSPSGSDIVPNNQFTTPTMPNATFPNPTPAPGTISN